MIRCITMIFLLLNVFSCNTYDPTQSMVGTFINDKENVLVEVIKERRHFTAIIKDATGYILDSIKFNSDIGSTIQMDSVNNKLTTFMFYDNERETLVFNGERLKRVLNKHSN